MLKAYNAEEWTCSWQLVAGSVAISLPFYETLDSAEAIILKIRVILI